jgi:hypothetical protein
LARASSSRAETGFCCVPNDAGSLNCAAGADFAATERMLFSRAGDLGLLLFLAIAASLSRMLDVVETGFAGANFSRAGAGSRA